MHPQDHVRSHSITLCDSSLNWFSDTVSKRERCVRETIGFYFSLSSKIVFRQCDRGPLKPRFRASFVLEQALIFNSDWNNWVTLLQTFDGRLSLGILDNQPDQLSSLAQVFDSSFFRALIPTVDYLYIPEAPELRVGWEDIVESIRWLEVFRPFNTVKGVYISRDFAPRIASSLQELVGERVTEVLPTLKTLFLQHPLPLASGPVQEAIGKFVVARQLAGHPITVSRWENEVDVWVQLGA